MFRFSQVSAGVFWISRQIDIVLYITLIQDCFKGVFSILAVLAQSLGLMRRVAVGDEPGGAAPHRWVGYSRLELLHPSGVALCGLWLLVP